MTTVKLNLADGGVFQYDDQAKEEYRITNKDGTVRLKIEGCPELLVHAKSKKRQARSKIVDAYVMCILDPSLFVSKIKFLKSELRKEYPYLDAYIEEFSMNHAVEYYEKSISGVDEEYGCQFFFLYLSGVPTRSKEGERHEVSYYINNMVGGLSKKIINGMLGNEMVDGSPLIYTSSCIIKNEPIPNRTFSAGYYASMAGRTVARKGIKF